MFTALQGDYTSSIVIGGITAAITLILVVISLVEKSFSIGLLSGIIAFTGLFTSLGSVATIGGLTYEDNKKNLENYFEEQYSGDFSFAPGRWRINMDSFANVEDQRITVERKVDNAIYLYRLTVGEDETQPALIEIVAGDRSDYPPLQK